MAKAVKDTNPLVTSLNVALASSGLTKNDVVERMGTSMSQLNRILNPKTTNHTVDALQRFADALGRKLEVRLR